MIALKRCAKCLNDAVAAMFGRCARSKDGLQSYCKGCQRDYNAGPRALAQRKRWDQDNRRKPRNRPAPLREGPSAQEWRALLDEWRDPINAIARTYAASAIRAGLLDAADVESELWLALHSAHGRFRGDGGARFGYYASLCLKGRAREVCRGATTRAKREAPLDSHPLLRASA